MANGIEDLTSIMTQGGRDDIPQRMMGGGLGAMMPQQSAPMPPPDMGGMSPDMMMSEEMAMQEEPMSIEQDSAALAEAVVGRAQGDIGAAVAILDTAKAMLIQSTQQDPMMMADGGQLKAIPENNKGLAKLPEDVRNKMGFMNMGGPLYAKGGNYMDPEYAMGGKYMDPEKAMGGKYMYAAIGKPLTSAEVEEQSLEEQNDTLRQMIMNGLNMFDVTRGQGMILNEGDLMGMGRTMSDAERSAIREAIGMQSGRELTQKDLDFLKEMMNSRREGTFDPEADNLRLDMGLDAQYYNELEDERRKAAERAKAYRSR
jgi:hypothetical protein